MDILLIQTGGTIDKDYPIKDNRHVHHLEISERPAFDRIIARARLSDNLQFSPRKLLLKGSRDITDSDRGLISDFLHERPYEKIIITHGINAIKATAETLSKQASLKSKVIVLTGANLPERFRDSDADFNLGMAVAAVQILKSGIYITLRGEVKPWYEFE